MPERQQDHERVAAAMPVALGRLDQLVDLVQMLAGTELGIWLPAGLRPFDCAIFDGWQEQRQVRLRHGFGPSARALYSPTAWHLAWPIACQAGR